MTQTLIALMLWIAGEFGLAYPPIASSSPAPAPVAASSTPPRYTADQNSTKGAAAGFGAVRPTSAIRKRPGPARGASASVTFTIPTYNGKPCNGCLTGDGAPGGTGTYNGVSLAPIDPPVHVLMPGGDCAWTGREEATTANLPACPSS